MHRLTGYALALLVFSFFIGAAVGASLTYQSPSGASFVVTADGLSAIRLGLFYLDSFGASVEDVKLMRWLREKLGPDVLTFAETPCDTILPFSGGYTETRLKTGTNNVPEYWVGCSLRDWEIFQWLAPGAQLASRYYDEGPVPAGVTDPYEFSLSHHIVPLLPAYDFWRAPGLAALQEQYLSETNGWGR